MLTNHIKKHRLPVKHQHFSSGKKALQFLEKVHNEKSRSFPEIIIWDRDLRDMDGFAFLEFFGEQYAASYPQTRVFLVSSAFLAQDKIDARAYSFVGHLISKPVSVVALNELIRQGQQRRFLSQ